MDSKLPDAAIRNERNGGALAAVKSRSDEVEDASAVFGQYFRQKYILAKEHVPVHLVYNTFSNKRSLCHTKAQSLLVRAKVVAEQEG